MMVVFNVRLEEKTSYFDLDRLFYRFIVFSIDRHIFLPQGYHNVPQGYHNVPQGYHKESLCLFTTRIPQRYQEEL
jgi:hypothetical protein